MTSKTTKLPAESTVAVSNARRGWYRIFPVILGEKWDPAVAETSLAAGDTLVLLEILIPGEDIEEQDLQRLCEVFSFFVQKKLDLILRFSYDFEGKGREKDPSSLSVVERHMTQIFPVLNEFADHIFVLQGIFLGSWGEMHSSRYLTKENIQKLEKEIKENLSPKIIRSVRKPVHWRMLCTDEKEVFSEKIGLYNDGMFWLRDGSWHLCGSGRRTGICLGGGVAAGKRAGIYRSMCKICSAWRRSDRRLRSDGRQHCFASADRRNYISEPGS